tara:strand:+ start:35295 stop:37073 length:1779 start_codon:yes stop_codon:yes gene_type:complete
MKTLSILILLSLTQAYADSIFDRQNQNGDGSLTLEEERQAEGYVHEGLAQERLQEICSGQNKDSATSESNNYADICSNGDNAFGGGWGMVETMMPIVSKAYSAIGVAGLMGNGGMDILPLQDNVKQGGQNVMVDPDGTEYTANEQGQYTRTARTNEAPGTEVNSDGTVTENPSNEAKPKKENKKDYCAIIPGLTDMAATTMQAMDNEQIQNGYQNAEDMAAGSPARQAQAFYAMSRSHEARKKSSNVQMYGWGATTGCYVTKLATGYASLNTGMVVKMGLSTAVTLFYMKKAKVHGEKAELLKALGDSFPKAGECNPHTETQCFCSQESSMAIDMANYQKYCIPMQFANRGADAANAVPCVDANGQADPECKCKKRRACIDAKLMNDSIRLGLNPSVMRNASQSLSPLSTGLDSAGLGPGIEERLAMAKKALAKYNPKKLPNLRGNPKAQKFAEQLSNLGIPKAAAATIAAARIPVSGSTGAVPSLASAGLNNTGGANNNAFKKPGDPQFKSGGSDGNKFKSGGSSNPFAFKKGANRSGGVQIEQDVSALANKATMEADINKDSGRGIFDILSHRYKMRAWKEFEDSMKVEQ